MKLKILKVTKKPSKNGGFFYYISFCDKEGSGYYTYINPRMKNSHRWKKVMKEGTILTHLKLRNNRLIDADSRFQIGESL